MKSIKEKWVDSAIFYQIYPTSFYDSDGDGIGDLKGITEKLWYIEELGVNALWINPFFKSSFKDGGFIRTGARTPMQWDDSKNRGFSLADEIYLPVNDKESQCVNSQEKNANSLLSTVKKLI